MARAVDLISHGAGEGLYYCLNAMAALFHGGKHSYIGSIMVISSMFAASIAVYKMVLEQRLQVPAQWLLVNVMLTVALTVPTTNVNIIDRVTGFRQTVANVPWLFAVPAGFISQLGDAVARQIDSALKEPGNVNTPLTFKAAITANRNGVAMTAKLLANAAHFDFVSYSMANNMREFVKECVYYDIALGKYEIGDLKNTDNLWKLVSENASPLGGVIYRDGAVPKAPSEFLTCKEAAVKIQRAWPLEINEAYKFYGKKLFPNGGKLRGNEGSLLRANLVHAYDYLTDISKGADELMQQNIMRNAIQDGFIARAQEDGATASIQSYAIARAEAYQEAVYATQGGIAEKAVSYMKIVIEIIFYGMFPFVAIMVVLPGGAQLLKTYFTGLIWLQSWAPLYSLINMIIQVYCREHTITATATTLSTQALTFDTIPALGEAGASVARYAGYAMMSVPFLSWGLFKYGGGALAQMSSYMGQPTQSAAGMAAGEVTSGNMSFGVRNFDSTSRSNINSFKQDENANIASGSTSFQSANGSSIRITSGGDGIIDRVAGMSKLGVGITDKNELASGMSEMSSQSLASANTQLSGYSKSMSAASDLINDFRNSKGNSQSSDASVSVDQSSSMSKAFQNYDNVVDSYSKATGRDRRQSVEDLSVWSGGVKGSLGVSAQKALLGLINGKAGADVYGGWEGRHQSIDSDTKNTNMTSTQLLQMGQDYKESLDTIKRESQSDSFRNSSTEAASFSDGISSRLSEADSYKKEMQNSLTDSASWQQSANLVSTSSVGVSEDITQEFQDWGICQPGRDGYALQLEGFNQALENPIQRKELINGFMHDYRKKILETYSLNKINDQSSINASYKSSESASQWTGDIRNKFEQMSGVVINRASDQGLDQPLDTSVIKNAKNIKNAHNSDFMNQTQALSAKKQDLANAKNKIDGSTGDKS